ncbi:MAG TPA: VOC family protein [Actinomycetes bacterium]|nr:VOC family protein [Actinomycetes bacterium]
MGKLQVTVDCADPSTLTRFWALALGYVIEPAPDDFPDWRSYWLSLGIPEDELEGATDSDSIVDPTGNGPRIWFQLVPEPKVVKNRLHFDLNASGGRPIPLEQRTKDVLAEVLRLEAAGASQLRVLQFEGADYFGVVMQDPEGNEFCVS